MENTQPTRRIGIKGYLAAATLPQGLLFLSLLTGGLLPAYYWLLSRTSTPFGSLVLTMVALAVASVMLVQLWHSGYDSVHRVFWSDSDTEAARRVFDWRQGLPYLAGVGSFPALWLLADLDAVQSALRELGGAPEFVVVASTVAGWAMVFAASVLSLLALALARADTPMPPCWYVDGGEEGAAPADETQAVTPAQTNA